MNEKDVASNMERLQKLQEYALTIASEHNPEKSMAHILWALKDITRADGGTFYSLRKNHLVFELMLGPTLTNNSKSNTQIKPLPLYGEDGRPNKANIACRCALSGEVINVANIALNKDFNFTGVYRLEELTGHKTQSLLAIPLKTNDGQVLGVIELAIASDAEHPHPGFAQEDVNAARFLGMHAAITLSNYQLNQDLQQLFFSMAEVLAYAIDNKSYYTGKHCHRVPEIAMLLLDEVLKNPPPTLANFKLTDDQIKEMRLAALLHDCGKVTTPAHIMDKAFKLETIFDRVHLIATRFEILKRDAYVAYLKKKAEITQGKQRIPLTPAMEAAIKDARRELMKTVTHYNDDLEFIRRINRGVESMADEDKARLAEIAGYKMVGLDGKESNFLTDDEIKNLAINRGTLTDEERKIINNHIVVTLEMLNQMKFPANLKNIPEIAGSHHERVDGKGYPRGLTGAQMSPQAKILAIADTFEALTANDRPYRQGNTIQESLEIMGKMAVEGHFDLDLFTAFIDGEVYLKFAKEHLKPEQYAHIDLSKITGYILPENRDKTSTMFFARQANQLKKAA